MISENIQVKEFNKRWNTIAELIKKYNFKYIAEIGVEHGVNAREILKLCPEIKNLFLVDFYVDEKFYIDNFKKQTSFLKVKSAEAIKFFKDESLDLVFIDADHSYNSVKEDIELWFPKVRCGGILAGHDYHRNGAFTGVKQAVDERFEKVFLIPDEAINGPRCVWWIEK